MLTQDYNRDEFSAAPKVVASKPKYKDPYGATGEYVPQNIMYDKRVFRGSNHAATVVHAGSKSEEMLMERKRQQQRIAKRRQQQAAEQYTRREIPTPEPLTGRQNLDVQTDQFVEELTDKAPCYEIGCQTPFQMAKPEIDYSIPVKTGTDFCAQIEDGDLFIFDDEVEPILQVLCGKTLEHAKMEVLEEEELRYMREEQKHFQKMREDEIAEAQKLESIELRKKQEIERRKQQHKVKKLEKIAAHKKYSCREMAKKFISPLSNHSIMSLAYRGAMVPTVEAKLYEEIVPWLHEKAFEFLIDDEVHNQNQEELLKEAMNVEELIHRAMIEKEHKRIEDERIEAENQHKQKLFEKEQRRLERERKRREEELRKLKEDIDEKFIKAGESVEGIVFQELATPNADYVSKNVVGAIGGPFVQIAIVLSVLRTEEYEEFYNMKNIALFLMTYLISQMKPESFSILFDTHIQRFCEEHELPLEELTKLQANKAKAFRDLMKDRENGMLNAEFRFVNAVAKEVGMDLNVFHMIHDVLSDILTRKPKAKEGTTTKQDQILEKLKIVTKPENYQELEHTMKAIIKIKIPMVEKVNDDDKSEDSDESDAHSDDPGKEKPAKEVEYEEMKLEDKIQLINPNSNEYKIMVLHQAGARWYRKEIASLLKKITPIFEDIDPDEVSVQAESVADKLEQKWIDKQGLPVFEFALN